MSDPRFPTFLAPDFVKFSFNMDVTFFLLRSDSVVWLLFFPSDFSKPFVCETFHIWDAIVCVLSFF